MIGMFFRTLPRNIVDSFKGPRIFFHAIAIVSTIGIVQSGLDWDYLRASHELGLYTLFFPAVIIGAFVPVSFPLFLLAISSIYKRPKLAVTGWAIGQAALIGSIISSTYKAFTGRTQPDLTQFVFDSSHGFHFGFLEHGVFWGWPSSHTTIAFAMAVTLMLLHPRSKRLALAVLAYAFFVGLGVSFSIHWFSEFVAGALIGTAIGLTVGASYRKHAEVK